MYVVVVHDLDKRDERELREFLERQLEYLREEQKLVLIPIEEIEAWLLCDPRALRDTFHMTRLPRLSASPERVRNPKELLGKIINGASKTHYVNTIHNKRIVGNLSLSMLTRCPSFKPYPRFLGSIFPPSAQMP
jgi:hypothetical protein